MDLAAEWGQLLAAEAASYARVALANIRREFPSGIYHEMTRPGDYPFRPKARTPVFYGSYDWHSCVEMHWLLVRLLRLVPGSVPAAEVRSLLGAQFSPAGLAAEARFIAGPDGVWERPYGWAWALALAREVRLLESGAGGRWSAALEPLAAEITGRLLAWLPKADYPVRHGVHANSAFALSRALGYAQARAQAGDRALLDAVTAKAGAWFGGDTLYPGSWEPSGHDFLSPALCEAELMAGMLEPAEFAAWLSLFLPGIAGGEPAALFIPAVVSDPSDGQIAHLHGLNASRAWCWRRIAESLPPDDPRAGPAVTAARAHARAVLPHVTREHYMVEHWLAAYAVLMLG